MITYSTPVFKNGFLLGLSGMDITLDELNTQLKKIDIYKGTDALIIDSKFNFIAGDKFKIGDNILNTKNGLYKFLKVSLDKQKSGFVEYKDSGIDKIITFSTLPNGFILLLDVPISEVLSEMNNIIYLLTFVAITVIFIASIIAFRIGNKLSKPIEELSKLSQRLANSDLTVDIKTDNSCEEMRSLSLSFNKFTQHLKDLIKQIANSALDVSMGTDGMSKASEHTALVAQQVSSIANQLAEGSQEESDSINNCLNNVNSMFISINKISDNTQVVVKLANESENNAESGFNLAGKAIDKIKIIKANTIETSQATNKLNNLASEIGIIVDLIKNIANQTNLLALNAAIEAARAGEHGKGFAVVADEVKKLATQSADATNKITDMIKQIQDESHSVSSAMNNSTNMVEEGVLMVENVGTNLEEILNATKEVSNNAKEVFKLINDAASNSESVIKTMENISAIVEQSTASTQQVAGSTQEQTASLEEINASSQALAQTAEDLKRLISVFKI